MLNFFKKTKKKEPESLKEVLECLKRLEKSFQNRAREFEEFKKESRKTLQKVGVVRFNPFKEMGGDQSFSIAALNADNDGFVITSHYGRDSNRVYAKPIIQGESKYQLSKEEKEAVEKAIGS